MRIWLLRCLDSIFGIRVSLCFGLEQANARLTPLPPGFRGGFVEPRTLARYMGEAFDKAFLEQACAESMDAYAIFHQSNDGGRLATVNWLARKAPVRSGDYLIHFEDSIVYGHRVDTHPDYRGRGLFPCAVHRAMQEYQAQGFHLMLANVEAHNLSSIRGAYRGGHRRLGLALIGHCMGQPYAIHTPG